MVRSRKRKSKGSNGEGLDIKIKIEPQAMELSSDEEDLQDLFISSRFRLDENVMCFYNGTKYPAKILDIKTKENLSLIKPVVGDDGDDTLYYCIHYINWSKKWDEWVLVERLSKLDNNAVNGKQISNEKKGMEIQKGNGHKPSTTTPMEIKNVKLEKGEEEQNVSLTLVDTAVIDGDITMKKQDRPPAAKRRGRRSSQTVDQVEFAGVTVSPPRKKIPKTSSSPQSSSSGDADVKLKVNLIKTEAPDSETEDEATDFDSLPLQEPAVEEVENVFEDEEKTEKSSIIKNEPSQKDLNVEDEEELLPVQEESQRQQQDDIKEQVPTTIYRWSLTDNADMPLNLIEILLNDYNKFKNENYILTEPADPGRSIADVLKEYSEFVKATGESQDIVKAGTFAAGLSLLIEVHLKKLMYQEELDLPIMILEGRNNILTLSAIYLLRLLTLIDSLLENFYHNSLGTEEWSCLMKEKLQFIAYVDSRASHYFSSSIYHHNS